MRRPSRLGGLAFRVSVALTVVALVGGCSHLPFRSDADASVGTVVRAGEEATVNQQGAALHLPSGSLDRDTTVRVIRATDSPSGLPDVEGFDFDIGEAQLLRPAVITLPVTGTPATGPDNLMLVPFQSEGRWGTEIGTFDPVQKVVRVEVRHLSWYTGAVNWLYGLLRKNLGDRLAHFRTDPPNCDGSGPDLSYPLKDIGEPPLLACVFGNEDGGTLKIANNRGFYLMITPHRGLSLVDVHVDGSLDFVISTGGSVIRQYLARWGALPLPPGATATFAYRPVDGGPALSFKPDEGATALASVLNLFSGIDDNGDRLLWAFDCLRRMDGAANKGVVECVIDYLAGQVEEGSKSPKRVLKLLGRTVSRAALTALTALLMAIPALDMVVENRDDGSTGDLGVEAYPRRSAPPAPPASPQPGPTPSVKRPPPSKPAPSEQKWAMDPHAPPATDPGQPPLPANAKELGGVDLDRYCSQWGLRAYRRYPVAYGWQCGTATTEFRGWQPGDQHISVDDACRQQYGVGAKSHYRDYANTESWFCWRLA